MAYLGCLLISLGLFFMLTGVLGVIRFDAFFSKVHASGTMDSLATPLLIFEEPMNTTRILTKIRSGRDSWT